ncbi:chromosome segregation protein SMC [Corchorus olitorius]|uniref:Chromosome segregation protein SMC n=1 Tax=Corchorus olitorius TaxID=93759 RepID=A0A1R3FXJ8_9ROSI|nr:chromosome segregation protein SMC [Corchorus olitorius]
MFNARENAVFKMPPSLPNCSPSFKSWWAGQWKSITDKENVEVIATRLAPPGGKRITKPKKKRVAPNQSSDEENGAPLKKKPTLNASAKPASSNPTDDHLIAEAKKPEATKPSPTVSSSPLPVLKPASFLPQVSPSKEDTGSKLATPMTPSAWMAKTPSATPPSDPSPPEEASSASKTKEPCAKKTLDFDTPLDLALVSPTGPPAKETLNTSLALKEKNLEPIYAAAHVWSFSPGITEDTAQFWHYFPQSFQDAVSKLDRLSTALDQTEGQRSEFERCQEDIENENSKVFEVAIPTDEEFQVDSKISEVERKITDLQAELASLKAHRADLATKREQNTRERMDRLEVRTKELIARRPEIDEIDRQRAYLQFQIDQLSVEVESWNDYLPPRKEADNSDDTDGDDGEGEENS